MITSSTQPLNRITAWSYSRWQTYEQCPHKAKLQFIDKHKTEASPAMENGKAFHGACEAYLKSKGGQVPKMLAVFAKQLRQLKKDKVTSEVEWCFDSDWRMIDWYSRQAWLRLKIDALVVTPTVLRMIDFKTGKQRDDHTGQLSLYALAAFKLDPRIEAVDAELWYFDTGKIISLTFMRSQMEMLERDWNEKTERMLEDEEFIPQPNFMCRFCDFRKTAGRGLCEFG